eukprot:SAG31_NODE_15444_length_754_cov_1.876336_2_plen_73_part_01
MYKVKHLEHRLAVVTEHVRHPKTDRECRRFQRRIEAELLAYRNWARSEALVLSTTATSADATNSDIRASDDVV